MKNSIFTLVLASLLLLHSCTGFNCIEGTGAIVSEEIDLDIFNEINNHSSVDIELRYGQNQKVEVSGHQNQIDLLKRDVSSSEWSIEFEENVCAEDMSIVVTIPEIRAIEINGSGDIVASTPFQANDFELRVDGSGDVSIDMSAEDIRIDIDGSGDVKLNGYADRLTIEIDGSGDVMAYDLEAKGVSVDSDGSGDVEIHVEEKLDVSIKGSGNVSYTGEPQKMEFDKKGSGEIEKK